MSSVTDPSPLSASSSLPEALASKTRSLRPRFGTLLAKKGSVWFLGRQYLDYYLMSIGKRSFKKKHQQRRKTQAPLSSSSQDVLP
ncbi:hypothetical protein K1719_020054 [Acacia pycnantha]|nr:hypothetical protein K1719_020054 [Acacia pycnantha]